MPKLDINNRMLVAISGEEVVTKVSGDVVRISGETMLSRVSGETVSLPDSQRVRVSGESVLARVSGDKILALTASGDYIGISGTVTGKISGETVLSDVSGAAMRISGETVLSDVSGAAIQISGQTVQDIIPSSLTASYKAIGNMSGGEALGGSQAVRAVKLRNVPGNEDIWVGASGSVTSGGGYLLLGGEHEVFPINDIANVWLYAASSGDQVSYRGLIK